MGYLCDTRATTATGRGAPTARMDGDSVLDAAQIAAWLARIGRGRHPRSGQRYLARLAQEGVDLVALPSRGGRCARGVRASVLAAHEGVDAEDLARALPPVAA